MSVKTLLETLTHSAPKKTIGELRVVIDVEGLFVFQDAENVIRSWTETVHLGEGDLIFIVSVQPTHGGLRTLYDIVFLCKFGLCYTHDDFIEFSTETVVPGKHTGNLNKRSRGRNLKL